MESVEGQVAYVPRNRIKRLNHTIWFAAGYDDTVIGMQRTFAEEMAKAIVAKLVEYNKITMYHASDGVVECSCTLEIIVPHGEALYGVD